MLESRTSKLWAAAAAFVGFTLGAWGVMGQFSAQADPWNRKRAEIVAAVFLGLAAIFALAASISWIADILSRNQPVPEPREILTFEVGPSRLDGHGTIQINVFVRNPTGLKAVLSATLLGDGGIAPHGEWFGVFGPNWDVEPRSTPDRQIHFEMGSLTGNPPYRIRVVDELSRAEDTVDVPMLGDGRNRGQLNIAPKQRRSAR